MKFTTRMKLTYHLWRNKSAKLNQTQQLINLLDFLGVDMSGTKEAISEATYYTCMKLLSESIAKLPLHLMQYTEKGGIVKARKHPLYNVVGMRPNKFMTATTLWGTAEYNRNDSGDAFVLIQSSKERKDTSLWVLPSNQVTLIYDDALKFGNKPDMYYAYSYSGGMKVFGSEEILHFKGFDTKDGFTGMSVKDRLKHNIQGNIKAQNMVNKLYDNGFTAKAVVQYTGDLSDENVKKFLKGIESYAKGEMKDLGIENLIPLPVGSTMQPLNIKLADNQFIEVKQYSAIQIASAFGIKPNQIGDYTKSSYASAEAQQLSFYVETLLYIIKQYEEELNYKLLSRDEIEQGYHFKFNINVILRADFKTQVETLAKAVNSFLYTPNEAREHLDKPWVEGGDRLLGNGASIPVQYTGMQYLKDNEMQIV